jgi:hypothetical protein
VRVEEGSCIYCGAQALAREHWLPRSLGTFRGHDYLLNTICQDCNEGLGVLENEFAHGSPEAVIRARLGIKGRKNHRRVDPFYYRTSGEQPVKFLVHPEGSPYPYLAGLGNGLVPGSPLRQVILQDGNGRYHQFPIPDNGKAEVLSKRIRQEGLQCAKVVAVFAGKSETQNMRKLLTKAIGRFHAAFHDLEDGRADVAQVRAQTAIGISNTYTRAIAKIGFHYALRMLPHVTGAERQFGPIREFIARGGDWKEHIEFPSRQFILPLAQGSVPRFWGHNLCVEAIFDRPIVARVQFFVGPDYLAPPFTITLGDNPSRLVLDRALSHYAYYFSKPHRGYDGEIVQNPGIVNMADAPGRHRWGWRERGRGGRLSLGSDASDDPPAE